MAEQQARVISIAAQRAAREARSGASPDDGPGDAPPTGPRAAAASSAGPRTRPRCTATLAGGRQCRNHAVQDGRCRVHAVRAGDVPTPGQVTDDRPATGAEDPPSTGPRGTRGARRGFAFAPDEAYHRAEREAARRGFTGPAVDVLASLRDQSDEAALDRVRELVTFLRRRLTGDYHVDAFGFDEDLTTHVLMPLLAPLHRRYWRVASHGIEHVPATDGALIVANHAGTLPADALITRYDIFASTGRHARELGADLVFRTPFVGPLARKTGATLASGDDADRLLASGELVAVWPEGFKGLGKPWKDRYKLQRFGRGGFVATALRAQVPIVPTAIVGSEEIYPLLFDLRLLARALGLPYFPVPAQLLALPLVGPIAMLPLPSKWILQYGEPIDTTAYGPEAADDPMLVFDLTDQVRDRIQDMLHRNLMGRRSVFL